MALLAARFRLHKAHSPNGQFGSSIAFAVVFELAGKRRLRLVRRPFHTAQSCAAAAASRSLWKHLETKAKTPQKLGFMPLSGAQKMAEGVFQHAEEFSEVHIHEPAYSTGPIRPEIADSPGPARNPKPYILWYCIKMRRGE